MPSIYTPLTPEQQRDKRLERKRRAAISAGQPVQARRCQRETPVTYTDMDGFSVCVFCGREPRRGA